MDRVVIESPYAGDTQTYKKYLHLCMRDSIRRGEAPFASHGMYTNVLDDNDRRERNTGLAAGWEWRKVAGLTVVYTDYGISEGMRIGIEEAIMLGQTVEYRSIK